MRTELLTQQSPKLVLTKSTINSNTTTAGTAVDMLGYDALTFFMNVESRTDGTYTPLVQESDDNSTFTDAADADLYSGGVSSTPEAAVARTSTGISSIAYRGAKRYVKFSVVSTSVTTGGSVSVTAVLMQPKMAVGS